MSIFEKMQQASLPIIEQIKNLPFIIELIQGRLANDIFIFYLQQDVFYLKDYARALALVGARAETSEHCQQFLQFALEGVTAESLAHTEYLTRFQQQTSFSNDDISPSCFSYTHYLVRLAALAPIEEAIAALLPCFSIYYEIGTYIAQNCNAKQNPYATWINLYSGEDFAQSVQQAIKIINEIAQVASPLLQDKMLKAFITAAKLEWQFWYSAYNKEKWLI